MSKKTKGFLGLLAVLVLIAGFVIPIYNNIAREQQEKREEEKRMEKLYQHGFRLLEEQIATYIVEHYSGVSKVEFSPIFVNGGDGSSMLTVNIVPVIHDERGNKAYLGRTINNFTPPTPGLLSGISVLELDENGEEIIYLSRSKGGGEIDVSKKKHLPAEAELLENDNIDENITLLVEDGQLENVQKSDAGSRKAKVKYNLTIERGEYWEWR